MNRVAIEQLLPHRGAALWLDTVSHISTTHIAGTTTADCLALYGQYQHSCLLYEAAAQLCAVHGACQPGVVLRAYVAKVQQLQVHQAVSDRWPCTVRCELLSQNPAGALYQFEVSQAAQRLLSGNLLVVIEHA